MKSRFGTFRPRWNKRGSSTLEYVAIIALAVLLGSILYLALSEQEQPLMQMVRNAIQGEGGGAGALATGEESPGGGGNGGGGESSDEKPPSPKPPPPKKEEEDGGGFLNSLKDGWDDLKAHVSSGWDKTKEFVGSVWDDGVDYVTNTGKGGLLDDALDTVGVTSGYEIITGKDWYTEEELSAWDRTGGALIDLVIAKKAKKVGKGLGYLDDKLIGGRGSKLIEDMYQFGSKKFSDIKKKVSKKLCNCAFGAKKPKKQKHSSNDTDFSYDASKVKFPLNPNMGKVDTKSRTAGRNSKYHKKGDQIIEKRTVTNWEGEKKTLYNGKKDKVEVTRKDGTKVDVPYNGGFPKFDEWSAIDLKLDERLWFKSDRVQFRTLNKKVYARAQKDLKLKEQFTEKELERLKEGKDLERFTWHHHQDPGKMQLVPTDVHGQAKHTGGREIWGGGDAGREGKLDPSK